MSYKNQQKLILIMMVILGFVLAVLASIIGLDRLRMYTDNPDYNLTRLDLFYIIFVTSDMDQVPYLIRGDINLLFLPISYYLAGLIITSSSFLLKEKSYFGFIYSRFGDKTKVITWLKRSGQIKAIFFLGAYNIMVYIVSHICFLEDIIFPEWKLIFYVVLHTLNSIIAVNLIQEITFDIYCKKSVAAAFLMSVMIMIFLMIADMALSGVNILMFNKNLYFIDGILLNTVLYVFVKYMRNRFIPLPY